MKHGAAGRRTRTREYRIWRNMVERCENPKASRYDCYGARGITVAAVWRHDFAAFLAHIGPCPPGLTLDRVDNTRGYEPGNVRWATRSEQMRNTRRTHVLTVDGREQCLQAWSEETGIEATTIYNRIKRGWSIERAVLTPARKTSR